MGEIGRPLHRQITFLTLSPQLGPDEPPGGSRDRGVRRSGPAPAQVDIMGKSQNKHNLRPDRDHYGEDVLLVRPVARDWAGATLLGQGKELTVLVTPVNDAPVVGTKKPASLPLVPFDVQENVGVRATDLAGKTPGLTLAYSHKL